MAIPVARVHLKVAHAALPALLPTPPKWKMLPLLPRPPCVAAILSKPLPAKTSRADSDERWDAHKAKPPQACCPASSSSSGCRSPFLATVSSSAAHASSSEIPEPRKNARTSSPPLKPGRADSAGRWDTHKKAAIPASSSSSDMSSVASSSKLPISRASSAERWDVQKRCPPQADLLDNGESSSTGSNDIDMEEEILWKPRAMYAGPSFVVAAPQSSMVPMRPCQQLSWFVLHSGCPASVIM